MTGAAEGAGAREEKRATSYDVARLAGVSQSMVSRAFTPGASVSAEARERVLAAADELGYRPNLIARSLITQRSRLVAVAIGYMENQFYPALLDGLARAFSERGYRVILLSSGPDDDADPLLEEVLRLQVAAVVLASTRLSSQFAAECRRARVPVVLVNRRTDDPRVASVTGANVQGGREVAEFLLAGGHQRLAYLAGLEDSSTSREREQGFVGALRAAGHTLADRAVGNYDIETAKAAARAMLARSVPPDAIFCANDHMACAVLDVSRYEFGRRPGTDLSVVGFDNVALASWPSYDLTTYAQPVGLMADRVVEVTLGRLDGGASVASDHSIVPGELIVRGSARRPDPSA